MDINHTHNNNNNYKFTNITNNYSSSSWDLLNMAMEEQHMMNNIPISSDHNNIAVWPNYPLHQYHQNHQQYHQTTPSSSTLILMNHDKDQDQTTEEAEEEEDEQEQEQEEEEEELGAMKEMMYKIAAMQPVDIDPASIRKPKRRNVRISDDPQSVAARHRRERISERIRILQRLVPGGTKMDTASMLDEAIHYVKFLKRQIRLLQSNDHHDHHQHQLIPHCPQGLIMISSNSTTTSTSTTSAANVNANCLNSTTTPPPSLLASPGSVDNNWGFLLPNKGLSHHGSTSTTAAPAAGFIGDFVGGGGFGEAYLGFSNNNDHEGKSGHVSGRA